MRARAPASSANLGPGFDTLAVALESYVSVEVEPADSLRVHSEGEGAGLFDDASHLAARVVAEVLGHDRFAVTVRSQIPVARAWGPLPHWLRRQRPRRAPPTPSPWPPPTTGTPRTRPPVSSAAWAATTVEGVAMYASLPLGDDLAFVAMVPDRDLATPEARGVLPDTLSRSDAVFNLGRMGLLVAGLADPAHLRAAATEDRIHQPARTALFPEAPALLEALVEAGALAACWSGAGPTLIGFVTKDSQDRVRAGAQSALASAGVPGRVVALAADRRGLVYGDEAIVDL